MGKGDVLPQKAEILLYGTVKVGVLYQDERIWVSQDRMAALLGVQRSAIAKRLKNTSGDEV